MSAIKEMAESHYPFRFGGNRTIADKKRLEGYIDGANSVLEKIESLVYSNNAVQDKLTLVMNKIKELSQLGEPFELTYVKTLMVLCFVKR